MRKSTSDTTAPVHRSRGGLWRALILAAGLGVLLVIGGVAGVIGAYYYVAPGLPEVS